MRKYRVSEWCAPTLDAQCADDDEFCDMKVLESSGWCQPCPNDPSNCLDGGVLNTAGGVLNTPGQQECVGRCGS